jgi:DNA modification methylase
MKLETYLNNVTTGDCTRILKDFPNESIDLILTDPPYIASYRPRDGRTVTNDDHSAWLKPAFSEMFRVLRPGAFCVTFYGWPTADLFVSAFRSAGFRPVSHLSFIKRYSSYTGYTRAQHEVAYVLVKGFPDKPKDPIGDVLTWDYSGKKLHPTQKPVSVLIPLIETFSQPGDIVLDPFCGSGSSLVAAKVVGRKFAGIELDSAHADVARRRVEHASHGKAV